MALIFDLVRRRQSVLKLTQRAGQVYEQSAGLQRSAQERALLAKVATNPLRADSLGSLSVEDIALLVVLGRKSRIVKRILERRHCRSDLT